MIIDFNQDWRFQREGGPWQQIDLPHDAMLLEKRDGKCRNGINSGYFPGGKYRYEKTFSLPESARGQSVALHFEGVYQNCTVSVNGKQAGSHHYGFTAFDVDISDVVKPGENTVTVFVDNSLEPNCRWYSGSGIYRPVQLWIRSPNHIETVHLKTVSIYPPQIKVDVSATGNAPISVEILDGDALIAAGTPGVIPISGGKLWSAERPFLYTCVVKTDTDERRLRFGIRELQWSAQAGLTVNGQRVLLRGGCIHHDHGILGAKEYRDAELRRIRILKENGFNALRISHHPASQITLDICDELGMYVMNEAFDGWYTPKSYHDYARWFESDWKADLTAMVESSRNHPSVILYSVGNEVSETATEKGVRVCGMLTEYVHSLDATRPVTAGINVLLNVYARMGLGVYRDKGAYKPEPLPPKKGYREQKSGSAFFNAMTQKLGKLMFVMASGAWGDRACRGAAEKLDILGLNYASSRYDPDTAKYPERIMVGSETMASDLPYNWARVQKYPQLIGDFVWAAWDYLGESCMGWTYHSYPGLPMLANQGMIDITGKPLASMAFMQVVWGLRKEPYIGVRPLNHAQEAPSKGSWQFTNAIDSWNWPGFEGTKATMEVYAAGSAVRLLLNGREIGTRRLKDYKALFRLPYAPGVLTAQSLDETETVLAEFSLSSGEGKRRLSAIPEKRILQADSSELCYLPIEFVDEKGVLLPAVEKPVALSLSGPITLEGFGSALYKTEECYQQDHFTSYRGRCLAILRAGKQPGRATVTVSSADTEPITVTLEVE